MSAKITARLTVYFEDPFWVGVYERTENGRLMAARVVFGPEPKNYQVYEYFSRHFQQLKFSPAVSTSAKDQEKTNPKRLQREISRQLKKASPAGGTKSQQALKLLQEQTKLERKANRQKRTAEERERQFVLKQEKKKQKHRGH